MTYNYAEKELFYPDRTIMYRGGVKKNDFGHDIYDGKGMLLIKMASSYSRGNSSII